MLTVLFLVIVAVVITYYIRKKIFQFTRLASKPAEAAVEIGEGIVEGIGQRIKKWFSPKEKT